MLQITDEQQQAAEEIARLEREANRVVEQKAELNQRSYEIADKRRKQEHKLFDLRDKQRIIIPVTSGALLVDTPPSGDGILTRLCRVAGQELPGSEEDTAETDGTEGTPVLRGLSFTACRPKSVTGGRVTIFTAGTVYGQYEIEPDGDQWTAHWVAKGIEGAISRYIDHGSLAECGESCQRDYRVSIESVIDGTLDVEPWTPHRTGNLPEEVK